jgi:hypothetical protein
MTTEKPKVGQIWKDDMHRKCVVVGFDDDGFILTKRHDVPKKHRTPRGGYPVGPKDWAENYTLVEE